MQKPAMASKLQRATLEPPTADEDCRNAMELQLAGKLDLAAEVYRLILQGQPEHAAANYCLGMLHVQLRRPADALPYLLTALQASPQLEDYWLGYLEALLLSGQIDEAGATLALGRQHGLAGTAVLNFARRLDGAAMKGAESALLAAVKAGDR